MFNIYNQTIILLNGSTQPLPDFPISIDDDIIIPSTYQKSAALQLSVQLKTSPHLPRNTLLKRIIFDR